VKVGVLPWAARSGGRERVRCAGPPTRAVHSPFQSPPDGTAVRGPGPRVSRLSARSPYPARRVEFLAPFGHRQVERGRVVTRRQTPRLAPHHHRAAAGQGGGRCGRQEQLVQVAVGVAVKGERPPFRGAAEGGHGPVLPKFRALLLMGLGRPPGRLALIRWCAQFGAFLADQRGQAGGVDSLDQDTAVSVERPPVRRRLRQPCEARRVEIRHRLGSGSHLPGPRCCEEFPPTLRGDQRTRTGSASRPIGAISEGPGSLPQRERVPHPPRGIGRPPAGQLPGFGDGPAPWTGRRVAMGAVPHRPQYGLGGLPGRPAGGHPPQPVVVPTQPPFAACRPQRAGCELMSVSSLWMK
jgi:hypothetical protein